MGSRTMSKSPIGTTFSSWADGMTNGGDRIGKSAKYNR